MRIVVANQKGGVGKTTTAVNLSAALALMGDRVLLVDGDSQANASLGVGLINKVPNLYHVLIGEVPLEKAVYPTSVKNLFCVPSSPDLIGVDAELKGNGDWEYRLRNVLRGTNYDWIIIDTPPSLGTLTILALTAADKVIIPVQAEYYALEGLGQLLETLKYVINLLNPRLELMGVLVAMYDRRIRLSKEVYEELRRYFGDKLFKSVIPRNVKLAEAPSFGKPGVVYDPTSKGSIAYMQLAKEIRDAKAKSFRKGA